MDFLQKIMAEIGIAPIKINLITDGREFRQGEEMKGRLVIYSGSSDVTVDSILLKLKIDAYQGHEHIVRTVNSVKIAEDYYVEAVTPSRELDFSYRLPYFIPITKDDIRHVFHVRLNIKNAVDPMTAVPVKILPSLEMEAVLGAFHRLGFRQTNDSGKMIRDHQQFGFYPTGFMVDKFNQIEVLFNQNKSNLYIYLEVDRKARGVSWLFTKALYLDENHLRFTVPSSTLVAGEQPDFDRATELLAGFIEQAYRGIGED